MLKTQLRKSKLAELILSEQQKIAKLASQIHDIECEKLKVSCTIEKFTQDIKTLFPGSFILQPGQARRDPGWVWSRVSQNLGDGN